MDAAVRHSQTVGTLRVDSSCVLLEVDTTHSPRNTTPFTRFIGQKIEAVFTTEGCNRVRQYIQNADHAQSVSFEAAYIFKEQFSQRVQLTLQCESAQPPLFSITVEEVESLQDSQYRLMLTQYTIDKITDMVIWLDADARYVFVNKAATQLLGYSEEELLQLRVWDIDPIFDEAIWREHWREIEEKGSFTIETINRSKSGVDISIEVTVNLVEFNGKKYNCSIVRDITERKKMEAELLALNERIFKLSITDELTGLANRRHFDAVLEKELNRHARSGAPLSLLMLDVDAFKDFNDYYGHLAGDECLRRVAAILSNTMRRPDDLAARYGGEEFACILPSTGAAAASNLADKIRKQIIALAIPHAASPIANVVSASLGVVTNENVAKASSRDLLASVDSYLYQAKREGRNRVVHGVHDKTFTGS